MKKELKQKEETRLKNLTKPFTISLDFAKELEEGMRSNTPTQEELNQFHISGLMTGIAAGHGEANGMLKYLATNPTKEAPVNPQDPYNLDYWASVGLGMEYTNSTVYFASVKLAFTRMVMIIVGECFEQLQNEFESFTDSQITMLIETSKRIMSSICFDFTNTIDINTIYNYIASQYGSIDDDPNLSSDIEALAGVQCTMFSQSAISSLASAMFDAVYELCIGNGKCTDQDFFAIDNALKPIIFGAMDPLYKQALNFTKTAVYAFANLDPALIENQMK